MHWPRRRSWRWNIYCAKHRHDELAHQQFRYRSLRDCDGDERINGYSHTRCDGDTCRHINGDVATNRDRASSTHCHP
jgi:hypothetical protein